MTTSGENTPNPADYQSIGRRLEHAEERLRNEIAKYEQLTERMVALGAEKEAVEREFDGFRKETEKLVAEMNQLRMALNLANTKLTAIALLLRP